MVSRVWARAFGLPLAHPEEQWTPDSIDGSLAWWKRLTPGKLATALTQAADRFPVVARIGTRAKQEGWEWLTASMVEDQGCEQRKFYGGNSVAYVGRGELPNSVSRTLV